MTYVFSSQRKGTIVRDSAAPESFDTKFDGKIIYTTLEILTDSAARLEEISQATWEEMDRDSGKLAKKSKESKVTMTCTPAGRILEFDVLDDMPLTWKQYMRSFYEQACPIYPDSQITIGGTWTQSAEVMLPDSSADRGVMKFLFKAITQKQGYTCAIISYSGNMVIPILPNQADTIIASGVDRLEVSGLMYFAIQEGVMISTDERRKMISDRRYVKESKVSIRHVDAIEDIALSLQSITEN